MYWCLQLHPSRGALQNSQVAALSLKYSSHHFWLDRGKSVAVEVSVIHSILWENKCRSVCKRGDWEILISPWVFLVVADWLFGLTFLTSVFFFFSQVLFLLLTPWSGLLFSPPPYSSCGCFLLILVIWFTLERSFLESKELNNTDCAVTGGWVGLVYKEAYLWKEP